MDRTELFSAHRPRLFSLAYRMLGSVADAEDVVQEAFLRWSQAEAEAVQAPAAYLSTIVTRLCIDQLRRAYSQRQSYIGPWLPEPLLTDPALTPAQQAEQADALSMAFLLLLERLSPVERAVYLLREVFDYDFGEIARIVGKEEANCRQIAHRARRHLAAHRPRFEPSPERRDALVQEFVEACGEGSMERLLSVLSEDIVLYSDGGGRVAAALKPIYGPDHVARLILGLLKKRPPNLEVRLTSINGMPSLAGFVDGRPIATWSLHIEEGRIRNIFVVVNPDKLKGLAGAGEAGHRQVAW